MPDTRPKLLIVEDDAGLQRQLRWAYDDYQLFIAGNREDALEILRSEAPPVVTLDLGLPPDPDGISEGMALLAQMLAERPETKVIVASGHGERASARRAIAEGAWDFYQKPIDIEALGHIVSRAFHVHALESENRRLAEAAPEDRQVLGRLITAAPEMLKVARMIERVANANVTVMLLGASGTGKELLARGLHEASDRASGPFIAINCAAIPETLLESELFGHEKGAFTGAVRTVAGKIEQGRGRHAVPGRSGRHSARPPGEAAALPAGAGDRAARRAPAHRCGLPHRVRDASESRSDDR
ncbi:DNA-binding NtrC family response regulator [Sphingobium sp. B1D3A]|uniref:DNA-binding NtrC family response regulator n=1 Tax=Sphingobium lignivorans TaxID=2735886 RepID=A0ABR6NFX0_9SPHN|nr:DNA-binding NtrC family response regulator [Sphingobium lignivorans]